MGPKNTKNVTTVGREEIVGIGLKSSTTVGKSTNDDIAPQNQASPSTIKSLPQNSQSRPRPNFKLEDERHKRTFVFVDHLDSSIRNSAFVLTSADCSRSQSLKVDDSDSLTESARAFRDANEQQNMPRALSTFCQRIRIPAATVEPHVVRAGWLVQHLFQSLEEDGKSFSPNTFCYGVKGVKQVDPTIQRTQLHQRARDLHEHMMLQFEWGSDSKRVYVYKELLGQTGVLRCLVVDAKQHFAFNVFVDTRDSNYLRHFQKTVDFLEVIAIACYIYHYAAHFVATRNLQDLQSADKARTHFQNVTKQIIFPSQGVEANYKDLLKDQPIPLYRTLNDAEQASTCQEGLRTPFQLQQEIASGFKDTEAITSPLTESRTETKVEKKPKKTSASKRQAARRRKREKDEAAQQAAESAQPEIEEEQSTPLTAEDVKPKEEAAGEDTESVLLAFTSREQPAVILDSPTQRSIERLSREATPTPTVSAHGIVSRFRRPPLRPAPVPVPFPPIFSYGLPHAGTDCWLDGCNQPTSCWDNQTVIWPRCGPRSWVRYCCVQHLFADVKNHYERDCGKRPNLLIIDEASLPPTAGAHGIQRPYTLAALETFERHRQALHRSMSRDLNTDYYIFGDLDNMWGATGGDLKPPKEVLMRFRGTGGVVFAVALPAGEKKQHLNAALNLALGQGRAAAFAPGVMPREQLNFAFSAIKEELVSQGLWDEDWCDRVCFQMQLEFGFVVSPELY